MSARADWKKRVAQWKASGMTSGDFAAEHDLNPRTLLWWSSMLRRSDARHAEPTGAVGFARLVPVDAAAPRSAERAPLEIVLTSGRVVRVRPGFDAAHLRELLAALEVVP